MKPNYSIEFILSKRYNNHYGQYNYIFINNLFIVFVKFNNYSETLILDNCYNIKNVLKI